MKKIICEFLGGDYIINDFCFFYDGCWIIVVLMDVVIWIWDLLMSYFIDVI